MKYLYSRLHTFCRIWALLGGVLLLGIACVSVASILGRQASGSIFIQELGFLSWIKPVKGDFELVELGCANVIFAFLPYCHSRNKNFAVDLLSSLLPFRAQIILEVFSHSLYTVTATLFTWQLWISMLDKSKYHQSSMVLGIPLEWAYFPATLSLMLLSVTCCATSLEAGSRLFLKN